VGAQQLNGGTCPTDSHLFLAVTQGRTAGFLLNAVLKRRNGPRRFVSHGPSLYRSSHRSPVIMAAVAAAPRAYPAAPPAQAAGAGANLPVPQQLPQFIVPDVVEDRRTDSAGNIVVRKYLRGKLLGKVRCASVLGCLFADVGSATFSPLNGLRFVSAVRPIPAADHPLAPTLRCPLRIPAPTLMRYND